MRKVGKSMILLIWGLCFLFMIKSIKSIKQINNEKKYYKLMLSDLCDNSVLEYIKIYNKSNQGFIVNIINMKIGVNYRNTQFRQAQGWEIIKNNANVSDGVKDQLKTALISNGVPIKI